MMFMIALPERQAALEHGPRHVAGLINPPPGQRATLRRKN